MISYELVSTEPFRLKECSTGTGAACGAIFLTDNFEKLLHQRLGARSQEVLTPKRLDYAVKSFEGYLKCNFDFFSEDCEKEFDIPLPGAPDIPEIGLNDGEISLSK